MPTPPLPTEPWSLTRAEVDRILSACAAGDPDALAVVRILVFGPHRPSAYTPVRALLDVLAAREPR